MRFQPTTVQTLVAPYDGLLLDAYGVLIDDTGPLPGAKAFLAMLRERRKAFVVVTNGSSRTPSDAASHYHDMGLKIDEHEILSSGSVLADYLDEEGLRGQRTAVLGTSGSVAFASEAGAAIVDGAGGDDFDILVVANQGDYAFVPSIDAVFSTICRQIDAGRAPRLILTNPDIIYPRGPGLFGVTAGAVATMIEAALKARYGDAGTPQFVKLGKPFAPIFTAAKRRVGCSNVVMIGDQIATDVVGALSSGIAAALIATGVSRINSLTWTPPESLTGQVLPPLYLLKDLLPGPG